MPPRNRNQADMGFAHLQAFSSASVSYSYTQVTTDEAEISEFTAEVLEARDWALGQITGAADIETGSEELYQMLGMYGMQDDSSNSSQPRRDTVQDLEDDLHDYWAHWRPEPPARMDGSDIEGSDGDFWAEMEMEVLREESYEDIVEVPFWGNIAPWPTREEIHGFLGLNLGPAFTELMYESLGEEYIASLNL